MAVERDRALKVLQALSGTSSPTLRELADAGLAKFGGAAGLISELNALSKDPGISATVRSKILLEILNLQLKVHAVDPQESPEQTASGESMDDMEGLVLDLLEEAERGDQQGG